LEIDNPTLGLTYQWYRDATPVATGVTLAVTESGNYTVVALNGTCASDASVAIQITVTPRAIAGDIVVNDEDICADEQVTLTANLAPSSTISNPVFHWFADAALTASLGTGTT